MRSVFLTVLGSLALAACGSPPPFNPSTTGSTTGGATSTGGAGNSSTGTGTGTGTGSATGTGTGTGTGAETTSGASSSGTGAAIPAGTLWIGGANGFSPTALSQSGSPAFTYTCSPVATLEFPAQGGAEVIDGAGQLWTNFYTSAPSDTISMWTPSQLADSCGSRRATSTFTISQTNLASFAFDPLGNLWAASPTTNSIIGYPHAYVEGDGGSLGAAYLLTAALTKSTSTVFNPTGLAFDVTGNLWVGNYYSILMYHQGTLAGAQTNGGNPLIPPDAVLTTQAASDVEADGGLYNQYIFQYLAFDSSGNLWVTVQNYTAPPVFYQIVEYTAASLAALSTNNSPAPAFTINETPDQISGSFPGWSSIAFDAQGDLWGGAHLAAPNLYRFPAAALGGTGSGSPDIAITATGDTSQSRAFTLAFDPIPRGLPIKPGG